MMKRSFVPADFKADNTKQVTEYYEKLLIEKIPENAEALRAWLLKWNELTTVLSEVSCRRYVDMTSHTQDEAIAKAYMDFVENIDPICEDYNNKLEHKLIEHPSVPELEHEFGVYLRDVRTSLELFRKENIPLSTKETTAIQDYQKITSTMSVEHNGETKTLQQMATFLTSTDRVVREDAWKKIARRRLQDKEWLESPASPATFSSS